ncbi:MAG: zeta toxin family protein, partial [Erysipelotrichaceae bacterium]|nr:zeta toxin family protein [Erysipelotrichaceae bacterium]
MKRPVIIGVAGGSASGKTSVAIKLMEFFDDTKTVTIIRQDDYYKDQSHMP